jgi:hypothetical protein
MPDASVTTANSLGTAGRFCGRSVIRAAIGLIHLSRSNVVGSLTKTEEISDMAAALGREARSLCPTPIAYDGRRAVLGYDGVSPELPAWKIATAD